MCGSVPPGIESISQKEMHSNNHRLKCSTQKPSSMSKITAFFDHTAKVPIDITLCVMKQRKSFFLFFVDDLRRTFLFCCQTLDYDESKYDQNH